MAMATVPAILEKGKGNIGITFPDFPGCVSIAGDISQAQAEAQSVLQFHINGMAQDNDEMPAITDIFDVICKTGEIVIPVTVNIPYL